MGMLFSSTYKGSSLFWNTGVFFAAVRSCIQSFVHVYEPTPHNHIGHAVAHNGRGAWVSLAHALRQLDVWLLVLVILGVP